MIAKSSLQGDSTVAESIIQSERYCWVCGAISGLHIHHVYPGGNRSNSEKYGFKAYLCGRHHNLSEFGVHFDKSLDLRLKRTCQRAYEKTYSREEFIKIIGKNYLEDEE